MVETVEDFYIPLNSWTNLTSTPSQPKYYFFSFNQRPTLDLHAQKIKKKFICNRDIDTTEQRTLERYVLQSNLQRDFGWFSRPESVILMIESDDDICAVVSIQNFSVSIHLFIEHYGISVFHHMPISQTNFEKICLILLSFV